MAKEKLKVPASQSEIAGNTNSTLSCIHNMYILPKIKTFSSPLERMLQTVGKKTFVDMYPFRYDYAKMEKFLRSVRYSNKKKANRPYTPNSIERKIDAMRWITGNGYEKDALKNITKSKHVPSAVREKAKSFI